MTSDRRANPFCSLGSADTRNNGASINVLVIGNTVIEPSSPNRSD